MANSSRWSGPAAAARPACSTSARAWWPTGAGTLRVLGEAPRLGSSRVGYMLARDSLLPWCTALENAAFGARVRGVGTADSTERALRMLQEVGLADHAQALPKALSHGMRQRTALARTLRWTRSCC